jgi:hypothetical protein
MKPKRFFFLASSADGLSSQDKRQLHNAILDYKDPAKTKEGKDGCEATMGVHNHILDDVPEDTDIFFADDKKAVHSRVDHHLGVHLHGVFRRNNQIPR